MSYLSKLVKRLAIGRSAAVGFGVLIASCSQEGALAPSDHEIASLVILQDSVRLLPGQQLRLSVEVRTNRGGRSTNESVTWSSDDVDVATVDSTGNVLAFVGGETTIRAQRGSKSGRTKVVVESPSASQILLSPATISLTVGESVQMTATALTTEGATVVGRSFTWSSGDSSVAAIDPAGKVTAMKAGFATIRVTCDGIEASASLTVSAPVNVPEMSSPFFSDDFDSGTKSNSNGFAWNSTGSRVTVSSERAYSGTHALRFRYGPDGPSEDSSAEQRFNLGRNLAKVWIEYWLFIPANFTHRSESPSNNKFFMIWNTVYGSGSGTWQAGYEYLRSSDSTSQIRPMSSKEFGTNATYVTDGALGHPDQGKNFIGPSSPLKPGRWHQVRMQFQRSSASGATDGVMRLWVNDVVVAEKTDGAFRNLNDVGETVLRNGYFMGWANSGFAQETVFFIDAVRFFDFDPGWKGR